MNKHSFYQILKEIMSESRQQILQTENKQYVSQIRPCHGAVQAYIIRISDESIIMQKSYGFILRNAPRETDYIKAIAWVNEQMKLLNQYVK